MLRFESTGYAARIGRAVGEEARLSPRSTPAADSGRHPLERPGSGPRWSDRAALVLTDPAASF
ncbi:MAG: hypothetical protein OXM87_12545 [Truepera sp.]|nr:hypothetical protein [Truepera sp.]